MDVVTKEATATATIAPVKDDQSEYGEADVILSTSSLDRDGDELHAEEWKTPLPDYITFDTDHGMSVATTVGGGKPFINNKGQLQVRVGFSSIPRAQEARTLVKERIIRNVSVAFLNHTDQKSGRVERELLNGAFVAVPANPEAVILASKSKVTPNDLAAAAKAKQDAETKDAANYKDDTMAAIAAMFDDDNVDPTHRTAYFRGMRDLAMRLGAGFPSDDPDAVPSALAPSNRSVDDENIATKSSPPETVEAPTDAPDDAAVAETDNEYDVARAKALLFTLDID
jgi:hypothetical protein